MHPNDGRLLVKLAIDKAFKSYTIARISGNEPSLEQVQEEFKTIWGKLEKHKDSIKYEKGMTYKKLREEGLEYISEWFDDPHPFTEGLFYEFEEYEENYDLIESQYIIPPGLSKPEFDFVAHYHVSGQLPILLLGDTGVGKTIFLKLARRLFIEQCKYDKNIHPIMESNCAHFAGGSSDLNISRSELFGHVKGAFSGATKDKKGLVEEANDGLLILEEIGELPLEVQAMLLTFIEKGEYRRVGSNETKRAKTKIIGATNREANLRNDFRYRFFPFYIPPLYQRRMDVLYYFYEMFPELTKKLTKGEVLLLLSHNWPGNVREIQRIGKLLMREKYTISDANQVEQNIDETRRIHHLDMRDTTFNPSILNEVSADLKEYNVDTKLLDKILKRKRVSMFSNMDDLAFKELKDDVAYPPNLVDQYSFRICFEYKPFVEAYEGFLGFCGIFLQNPEKNGNILATLTDCDIEYLNYSELDYAKSDEVNVDQLSKQIMKYLKQNIQAVYIEGYKWPSNKLEFWEELDEFSTYYSNDDSQMEIDVEGNEEIFKMDVNELLRMYYSGLLKRTGGNKNLAAKIAGINVNTFKSRMKKLGV